MKNFKLLIASALILGSASLVACGDDSGSGGAGGDATGTTTASSTSGTPSSSTGDEPATTSGADGGGGEGGSVDAFVFLTDSPDAYTQIDRHGAVEAGTAGILGPEGLGLDDGSDVSLRDDYNASNPEEDLEGRWVSDIGDSVAFFHDALDADLTALSLDVATDEETLAQAAPVIVPDTIKYDPSQPTGYPNGRALTDQVVDITLAAVLLDLANPSQSLRTFADLDLDPDDPDNVTGLNPPANDVEFEDEFPYLAPPH